MEVNNKISRALVIDLTKALQPLTQSGVLTGKHAADIMVAYSKGDREPLKKVVYSPDIPMMYNGVLKKLENFL